VATNPAFGLPDGVTSVAQLEASELERFLAGLPQVSRPFIAKWFRQNPATTQKADLSPVTIADREVETALRHVIQTYFPDDHIQGEEFGTTPSAKTSSFCWIIDPIDGTKAFVSGKPVFGTLVGVTDQQLPVAGLIDMPALDETYIGTMIGGKAPLCRVNGLPASPSDCTDLAKARLATTSPLALSPVGLNGYNYLAARAAVTNYGGDCHNYALLAAGHIDLVLEDSLAPHDMMAVVAVMQAAGAIVTDMFGEQITLGQSSSILAAATTELHRAALVALDAAATR